MLDKIQFEKVLFFDIETVPQVAKFSDWDKNTQDLFLKRNKSAYNRIAESEEGKTLTEDLIAQQVFESIGGIQAEFGKIVCISVGFVFQKLQTKEIRMKSFFGDDEKTLLEGFVKLLKENSKFTILCGHNSKEFDIPYVCRRLLINGIKLPAVLDIIGKKPWEVNHIDTLDIWKFGDFKATVSLSLLCHVFGVPTPKDDISGADVSRVYYQNEKDVYESGTERIKVYCEKDVVALIQLLLKMRGESLIQETN